MELLRNQASYERKQKLRNQRDYVFVRKQQIGKVERNIFSKKTKIPGTERVQTVEYVKHNGKYMQLKNYKDMMKKKNLYQSPSPVLKKCKKDCPSIKKVCNTKTGRCNKIKTSKK